MKITSDFLILCQDVKIDEETKAPNLFGLIEHIEVSELPASGIDIKLVSRFTIKNSGKSKAAELTFKMVVPSGEERPIKSGDVKYLIDFMPTTKFQKTGIIINLSMSLTGPGRYEIRVYHAKDLLSSQDFEVDKAAQQ